MIRAAAFTAIVWAVVKATEIYDHWITERNRK